MLARSVKSIVKKIPALYSLLQTAARPFRQSGDLKRVRKYCSQLPERVQQPTFVMVGASDGITEDPVSDIFLSDARWKGVLIEPVPYCFQRLAGTFQDVSRFALEQVAIGNTSTEASFYYVAPNATDEDGNRPYWFDQVGSFDREHVLKLLGDRFERFIVECSVEVHPLSKILRRHKIDHLDFLQIDTEGYDYEILKTLDLAQHAPSAILVEHSHLPCAEREEMLKLLRLNGYGVDSCDPDNYFAIHQGAPLRRIVRDQAGAS